MMNNIEKLIENGGWRSVDGGEKTGEPVLLKNQSEIDKGNQSPDFVICDVWCQDRVQGDFDVWRELNHYHRTNPTHYMPLDTPERMAKVIEVLMMRMAQIASGDYVACQEFAEDVAEAAILEANEIAGR